MTYLWQKADWPSFNWSNSALIEPLVKARFAQGRLISLPSSFVHSYELSEIKKHIYADLTDPNLNLDRLNGWQASLFPTSYSGIKKIKIAEFRTKDLFRASLPTTNLNEEVLKYLHWWQEPPVELDPVIRAALSFFWFILLSPYEDGNFELACSICELTLQKSENTQGRYYDMALQLEENKSEVLEKIESLAESNGDLTNWLLYFLDLFNLAVESSYVIADKNHSIDLFWKKYNLLDLNTRQRKIINYVLETNIEEPIHNRFYVEICKTSRESAKRDLVELFKLGVLTKGPKKGRSSFYLLKN